MRGGRRHSDAGWGVVGPAVVLNNYLHDLATGTWVSAVAFQWALLRRPVPDAATEMIELLRAVRLISRIALGWIVAGGLVRAVTYRRYEWSDAAGRGQVPLLGFKHVLLFGAVALGLRLERRVDAARERLQT